MITICLPRWGDMWSVTGVVLLRMSKHLATQAGHKRKEKLVKSCRTTLGAF